MRTLRLSRLLCTSGCSRCHTANAGTEDVLGDIYVPASNNGARCGVHRHGKAALVLDKARGQVEGATAVARGNLTVDARDLRADAGGLWRQLGIYEVERVSMGEVASVDAGRDGSRGTWGRRENRRDGEVGRSRGADCGGR